MFRTVPLSITRSFSLYTYQWYVSYRLGDSLRAGSGRSSVPILLASYQQTSMTYTIAVCTVKNSGWWSEKLSETCRVLFQNKFEKLVHLGDFIIRIYHDARSRERQRKMHVLINITPKLQFLCDIRLAVPIRGLGFMEAFPSSPVTTQAHVFRLAFSCLHFVCYFSRDGDFGACWF